MYGFSNKLQLRTARAIIHAMITEFLKIPPRNHAEISGHPYSWIADRSYYLLMLMNELERSAAMLPNS